MIVSGHSSNPLVGIRPADMRRAPEGVTIASLAPEAKGILLCRVNGEWLKRESWEDVTRDGDVVEWHELPQDRDSLRTVLSIVVVAAVSYFTQDWSGGFGATVARGVTTAIGLAAVNAALPPQVRRIQSAQQTGNPFATSLQGNQARIDQPIWKVCGFDEITPPFAGQPYTEFLARTGAADPELDRDQYFYAVFCVGIGDHDVVAKIGNTPITRFDDVILAQYLAPGVQPTTALLNVVTAPEVGGEIMEPGRYVGGFAACGANRTVESIGIDVVAPKGLGKASSLTVEWQVEYREINDFGQVLGAWNVLGTETRTAFTATPQRWSDTYALPSAMRVEVRVVRTDIQDTSPTALHEIAWAGMRAYLAEPAPMNPNAAHFEVVMRATGQLNGQTTSDIRLQVKAHARTRDSGEWAAAEFTRNPGLWLLDLATNDAWGLGLDDSRIDLDSFDALVETCEQRQDRFDYTFESTTDAWDAMQLIARTCRARVFRRHGILSVVRDELQTLPVTGFAPRNSFDMRLREVTRTHRSPDAVIVQYRDHRTRDWTDIVCPVPGVDETDVSNPVYLQLPGVIGYTHAYREGLFEAASLLYRSQFAEWMTEMEGMLPAYLSPVSWQAGLLAVESSGDIEDVSGSTLKLSHTVGHSQTMYIRLIRPDGTITDPIEVSAGATAFEVVLASALDFVPETEGSDRERTKYMIGPITSDQLVKVTNIADGGMTADGAQLYQMAGFVDDDRIHEVDLALLPETDEIQDPIGLPDGDAGTGETLLIPYISARTLEAETISGVGTTTDPAYVEVSFNSDGTLSYEYDSGSTSTTNATVANQWLLYGAVDGSDAAAFEVEFVLLEEVDAPNVGTLSGDTLSTWLSLGTTRTFRYEVADATDLLNLSYVVVRAKIRDVATEVVQTEANFTLRLTFTETGGE